MKYKMHLLLLKKQENINFLPSVSKIRFQSVAEALRTFDKFFLLNVESLLLNLTCYFDPCYCLITSTLN